ncbi:unnamed protein product [Prorocentrum cordatum]|uniref:Pentatricopeptide repeat-containing protein, chloroplastic n=1 Tax=Prorocentrum cordatum TaxID=2364126 RepID=A0ABN9QS74_9DINO|nr:unnamed protein product [Polarella glacialis]
MREAKLEPDVISQSAGISACEKGGQWQRALALLSEMWEAKLEPNVISYNAGISACEKGEQWQRALALLSEMWEVRLEPDVISYSAGISACENGEQWQRALALLSRDAGGEARAQRSQLQPCDRRPAPQKRCDRLMKPLQRWQRALALFSEMFEPKLVPDVTSYNAGFSTCAQDEQWQKALARPSEMREARPQPDAASYSPAIVVLLRRDDTTGQSATPLRNSARVKGGQWLRALALLDEMWEPMLDFGRYPNFSGVITGCKKRREVAANADAEPSKTPHSPTPR